jgi:hypothetical protein
MAIRGTDSKAMRGILRPVVTEEVITRVCPHPFCSHRAVCSKKELQAHYRAEHRCGRCNQGLHRKCKEAHSFCGCGCHCKTDDDLRKMMQLAKSKPKVVP